MRRSLASFAAAGSLLFLAAPSWAQGVPSPYAQNQPLTAPAPMDPNAPGSPAAPQGSYTDSSYHTTTARLDEAEREDSKRKFEVFWIDAHLGGSYIDMRQLSDSDLRIEKASAGGPAFSLGAGARFLVLVVGARARYNALSSFNMWQLNGEVGLKLPISAIDFLIGVHGGYSFVGSLGDAALATNTNVPTAADQVKVRGFNAGLDVGLDYYVSPTFSVGVGALGDFLFLNRPPVDKPEGFDRLPADQQAAIDNDPIYQRSGSSAGFQAAGFLRLGLHFGL